MDNGVHDLNLLDKIRRFHRHERAKHPNLAAAVAGAGTIKANGKLRGVLRLEDGSVITYVASPRIDWTFEFKSHADNIPGICIREVTQADKAKAALNTLLTIMSDAEQAVRS